MAPGKKEKKPKSRSGREAHPGRAQETCFVMMPFTQLPKTYYELIYKPAIEAAGLAARRADDIYAPSPIISDIWREVRRARVMLADLTFRNPNVLYELGLAHAIGKPVVMLTQVIQDVPFDLQQYRLIPYTPLEPDWSTTLANEITRSLRDVLKTPAKWVLPTFLRESDVSEGPSVGRVEKRLTSLERVVDRIEAQIRTTSTPAPITAYMPSPLLGASDYVSAVPAWTRISTVAPSAGVDPLNEIWSLPLVKPTEATKRSASGEPPDDPILKAKPTKK